MPTIKEVTTIPDLWDTLFASDSLTITVPLESVQPIKAALSKYKAKQMKKIKGEIETLVLTYKLITDTALAEGLCRLRIDLKRQGSQIEHMGITINDEDMESF